MLPCCRPGPSNQLSWFPQKQLPPLQLMNKAPHWNETLRCWCLNFRGRVKLASVKNFQLVQTQGASETVIMQVRHDSCALKVPEPRLAPSIQVMKLQDIVPRGGAHDCHHAGQHAHAMLH